MKWACKMRWSLVSLVLFKNACSTAILPQILLRNCWPMWELDLRKHITPWLHKGHAVKGWELQLCGPAHIHLTATWQSAYFTLSHFTPVLWQLSFKYYFSFCLFLCCTWTMRYHYFNTLTFSWITFLKTVRRKTLLTLHICPRDTH